MIALAPIAARFALPAALALSVLGNAWLLHRLGAANARADAEIAAAVERGRADAAEVFADKQAKASASAKETEAALKAELAALESQGERVRTIYRDRVREIPAPAENCGPGAEFMQAVNDMLGGES